MTQNPMYGEHRRQESYFVSVDSVTYDTPNNQTNSTYSVQGLVETNVYDYADKVNPPYVSLT